MSDIEKISQELFSQGRWIFGGDGSHWDGCHETHWDCALVHLTARIAELEARIARLEQAGDEIKIIADKLYNHLVLDHKSNLESVQLSIRDDIREYENIVTAWQRAKEGKE